MRARHLGELEHCRSRNEAHAIAHASTRRLSQIAHSDTLPKFAGYASWIRARAIAMPGRDRRARISRRRSAVPIGPRKMKRGKEKSASAVADQLRALGMKGVLVQMAERGQLVALECEMPQCYHLKGRGAFDPVTTPRTNWAPSPDHYPILKSAGGHLVAENVRLAHVWCNNRDSGWRRQIRTMLAKGKSLGEIAESLNKKGVPAAHGAKRWTAARVRRAYVS